MNAQLRIKNLLSKYRAWEYLVYLGISAVLVTIKGFVLGRLLNQVEYASYSYFQLFSGLGCVIAGVGIVLRCHVEVPVLLKDTNLQKLNDFLNQANSILIANAIVFTVSLWGVVFYSGGDLVMAMIGSVQSILMLFFTVELIKIKSNGLFTDYAKKLLGRNFFILSSSVVLALISHNAKCTAFSEVIVNLIFSGNLILRSFNSARFPDVEYIKKTMRFVPLELMGAFSQYQERIFASAILSKMEFSRFSYLFIIVNIGLTLQQFINTKLIVNFSTESECNSFRRFAKGSIFLFFSIVFSGVIAITVLFTMNLAPKWLNPDVEIFFLIVLISALKGSDITQSYLTCRHMKKYAFALQLAGSASLFVFVVVIYYCYTIVNLSLLLMVIAVWQFLYLFSGLLVVKLKLGIKKQ